MHRSIGLLCRLISLLINQTRPLHWLIRLLPGSLCLWHRSISPFFSRPIDAKGRYWCCHFGVPSRISRGDELIYLGTPLCPNNEVLKQLTCFGVNICLRSRFDSFLLVYRKTLSSWDCCQLMFHLRRGNTVNYSLQYLPLVIVRFYTNVNLVGFNCIICCHSLVLSLGDRRNTFWTMVLMAFALTALECISFLR